MTLVQNLQVLFYKRYWYNIITRDVTQLENLSKKNSIGIYFSRQYLKYLKI